MVELIRAHRFNQTKIVNVLFQMRQAIGDPLAALSRLVKGVLGAEQLGHAIDEGKAFAGQKRERTILAVQLGQFGLMLEKLQLAWRPSHVQIDNALRARSKLRRKG